MSDDTRDPIAEALDDIAAMAADMANCPDATRNIDLMGKALLADLATLRAALEQRKPTLPDSELLGELRKHDAAMTAGEWEVKAEADSSYAFVQSVGAFRPFLAMIPTALGFDGIWNKPVENAEGIAALRNLLPRIIAALEQADRHARGVEEELRGKDALLEVASAQILDLEARLNPPTYTTTASHEGAAITTTVPLVWDDEAKCFRATLDKRHTGGEG